MPSDEKDQSISRRDLLKAAIAAGGAVSVTSIVPEKWISPLIKGGVLPVHAQTSNPLPTNTPGLDAPTKAPATATPTSTATATPTQTATATATPTPTATAIPVFQIASHDEDFTCDGGGTIFSWVVISCSSGGSLSGVTMRATITYTDWEGTFISTDTQTQPTDGAGKATFQITGFPQNAGHGQITYTFDQPSQCTSETNCQQQAFEFGMGC